jgi:cystathionine beta-lyase
MILSDEIHADLQLQTRLKHACIAKYISYELPSITFFATSKTYNTAGMGGAVAIIPNTNIRERYIKHIQGVLPMLSRHSIEIIHTSLTMNNEWLENLLIYLRNNHDLLLSNIKQIKSLRMLPLEATYLAWIQYDEEILGDFQQRLYTNGLHVLRGDQFLGNNFIRINIACTKKSLEKALLIIKKTIDEVH